MSSCLNDIFSDYQLIFCGCVLSLFLWLSASLRTILPEKLTNQISDLQIRMLSAQGARLERRFERVGDVKDIDQAIDHRTQALILAGEDHSRKPSLLDDLGFSYWIRFGHFGELFDLNEAISFQGQALILAPAHHSSQPGWLSDLASLYQCRYGRLGEPSDLNHEIACRSQAIQFASDDHADKPAWLNSLGNSYLHRFQRGGELTDINEAVACQSRAVQLTPNGHPDMASRLNNLGLSYRCRFGRLGEPSDLDHVISCRSQAIQLTPDVHPDKPVWLNNLGISYLSRFEKLGQVSDITEAITCQSHAVQLTPDGHADKPGRLNGLGYSYRCRFERLGERSDGERAIAIHSQAVQLTPEDHPNMPRWLNNLGVSYRCRFQRLGDPADGNRAIAHQSQAVRLTPDGHTEKPGWLNDLGTSYMRRFEHLGELSDVNKAISCQTQALQLTPDRHADMPTMLNNLGNSYRCRFQRLGELSDIDEAIASQSRAVQLTPDEDSDKLVWLNNLGNSYLHRFEHLGEVSDVEKAISCQSQAVEPTPDGHPELPSRLNNLGLAHRCRFERLAELQDIDMAIESQSQAVQLTPEGHSDRPRWLNNLGMSYQCRFERRGELSDVENAVFCHNQAVQLTPDGHADKPMWLSSLAVSYRCRFESLGALSDVNNAILCQSKAVQLTPADHAEKSRRLNDLGRSYIRRFQRQDELLDAEEANKSFQQAALLAVGPATTQFQSAHDWAKSSLFLGTSPKQAYYRAMELVPQLVWLGTTIDQRHHLLAEVGGVALEAAGWAMSVQAYDLALEWLEAGRTVVWNQTLQLRMPFDDLSAVSLILAERLKQISHELEYAGSRSTTVSSSITRSFNSDKEAQRHHHLAAEWERLLGQARAIPGFHNFMRPRNAKELKLAATDGPIIIVNAQSTRCDALIIRPHCDEIAHLPLDSFSLKKAIATRTQFEMLAGRRGRRAGQPRAMTFKFALEPEEMFTPMLSILWSDIVSPVLSFLGYTRKLPVDQLPHVTWCTTGALSFLPLHAAGSYQRSQPSTFDLVVSSYTPTISALIDPSPPASSPTLGVLAVGQEHTPGLTHLPNTVQELSAVRQHADATRFLQLDGEGATVDAVLSAMDEYSWVHLACHAIQDPVNPAHSAFRLQDGKLNLESITRRPSKGKGLAFLSAGQTATGDSKLPDEAIHLAAGMQMAGYPSVIATMWSICDVDGPEVAREVYAELFKDGKMDCRGAARALHKAAGRLREKVGQDSFVRWVPFIHIGI